MKMPVSIAYQQFLLIFTLIVSVGFLYLPQIQPGPFYGEKKSFVWLLSKIPQFPNFYVNLVKETEKKWWKQKC